MRTILLTVIALNTASAPAFAAGTVFVRGYTKSNGTYVQPHVRTAPDSTVTNNFSYQPKPINSNSLNTNMGSFSPSYGSGYNK